MTVELKEISRLLVLALTLASPGTVAQAAVDAPRTIRVVMDNAYAPFLFQSNESTLQGILIDQWHTWETKTGIKAEIHAMDWGEALRRMLAGEFDVIDCIVETPERRDYFDFTPPYATIEASIFFRNDISGITDLASLRGFSVGVKTGDQHINTLRANRVMTLIPFPNNDAIIEAAKEHQINVFVVDDPSALYLLNKLGIEDDFRHSPPIFRDELRRAVRKGDAALLRTVSEGFAAIEPGALKQIDEKWFGRTINRLRRYLTYAGYAAGVAILLIAGLVGWNRTLRRRILQRTAALQHSLGQLRALAGRLQVVREEERKRVARELHDQLGQALTGIKLDVSSLIRKLAPDKPPECQSLLTLIDETIGSVRKISTELRPGILDDLGLGAAVEWASEEFQSRTGTKCQVDLPQGDLAIDRELATALFRILQETLTNVARHADATRVDVRLAKEHGSLTLEVHDNGKGISDAQLSADSSLGIVGMRERALLLGGELSISGAPGEGTTITVRLPETHQSRTE